MLSLKIIQEKISNGEKFMATQDGVAVYGEVNANNYIVGVKGVNFNVSEVTTPDTLKNTVNSIRDRIDKIHSETQYEYEEGLRVTPGGYYNSVLNELEIAQSILA